MRGSSPRKTTWGSYERRQPIVLAREVSPGQSCRAWGGKGRGAVELGLRAEIGLAGTEVDGYRDVLVDDEPPAPGLFVHIGHPHREIELLALLVGAGDALDAVAISKIAVG